MAYELYCIELQVGKQFNVFGYERKVGKKAYSIDQIIKRNFQTSIILKYNEINRIDSVKIGQIWISVIYIFYIQIVH